jgi:hypothetical protein
MALINDLPVFGEIIESTKLYFINSYQLIKSRSVFFREVVLPFDDKSFKKSMNYFSTGIALGFIFLVPFFILHKESASKFIFVIRQVIAIILYSYFIHLAFLLLRVKQSNFKTIATLMGYIWGLMFPLNFLLMLPLLIEIGPSYVFAGGNSEWTSEVSEDTLRLFVLMGTLGGIGFLIIWLIYVLPWISKAFGINKGKVIGGLLLGGIPSGLIIGLILGPLFNSIERILADWLMAV